MIWMTLWSFSSVSFASCNFTSHGCSDVYRFSIQWPPASTGGHLFFWHIALLNFSPGYIHVCSKGILNLNNYKTNDIQNLKKKKKRKKKKVTFRAALGNLRSQSVSDWFCSDSSVSSWQETLWDFVAELCKKYIFRLQVKHTIGCYYILFSVGMNWKK